jgi:hypothetical protein
VSPLAVPNAVTASSLASASAAAVLRLSVVPAVALLVAPV